MPQTNHARRRSAITSDSQPLKTRQHNGFVVVSAYEHEADQKKDAPAIIDLSHMTKWDIQDTHLSRVMPLGQTIPEKPGECVLYDNTAFMFRLNATQAGVWHIYPKESEAIPSEPSCTDVTDAHGLLAVVGPAVPSFIEKITSIDLMPPNRKPPFIVQGPILHITSRVVVRHLSPEHSMVLFSFARGFGQTMLDALLDSGTRQGVYFAGENRFFEAYAEAPISI